MNPFPPTFAPRTRTWLFAAPLLLTMLLVMIASSCGSDSAKPVASGTDGSVADQPTEVPAVVATPLPTSDDELPIPDDAEPTMTGEWKRVEQRHDMVSQSLADITDLGVIDDTTIQVRFMSLQDGCEGAEVFAIESETEVTIELYLGLPPEAASRGCSNVRERHEVWVSLAAPIGNRSLVAAKLDPATGTTPERSLDDYIGLSATEAMAKAEVSGRPSRVVLLDGEHQIMTDDYIARRLNFKVVDGIVTGLKTDAFEEAGDSADIF